MKKAGLALTVVGIIAGLLLFLPTNPCGVLGHDEFARCHTHAQPALIMFLALTVIGQLFVLIGYRMARRGGSES